MRTVPRSWLFAMLALPALLLAGPRVWPADAEPTPAIAPERPPSAPVITPGHLVVDRIDRESPAATGDARPNNTELIDTLEQQTTASDVTTRTVGGFVACFDDDVPSAVRSVFERSLAVWDSELLLAGPAIEIDVYWTSFTSASALAASGPSRFVQDAALPDPLARYPAALANNIIGIDYAPRGTCDRSADGEAVVYLNSTAGGDGEIWHIANTAPSGDKIDLESVITHELAHALGFLSSASVDSAGIQRWPFDFGAPYVYDTYFHRCAAEATCSRDMAESVEVSSLSLLNTGDLWFALPYSDVLQLYAPNPWDTGSSVSHLDENRYRPSSGFSLLSPYMGRGENHDGIDNATLSVMQTLGWAIARQAAAPTNVVATAGNAEVRLEFTNTPLTGAPAAIDYQVTLWREGFEQQTVSVPGSPVILAGLVNGQDYQLTVQSRTGAGFSSPSARSELVTPLEFPPFATAESFVGRSFQQLLGRAPTESESASWAGQTRASEGNFGSVLNELADGREVLEQRQIVRLYLGFFNRQPDAGGLDFWITRGRQGESLERIALQFARATEFEQGAEVSNEAFVSATYNRVLGRTPDAGGLEYWISELRNGLDRGRLLLLFSESPEHIGAAGANSEIVVLYRSLLSRSPTASELDRWTSIVNNLGRLPLIQDLLASDEYRVTVVAAGR